MRWMIGEVLHWMGAAIFFMMVLACIFVLFKDAPWWVIAMVMGPVVGASMMVVGKILKGEW